MISMRTTLDLPERLVDEAREAIAAYREAIRLRPTFGEAYWSLANLKTYRFNDTELQDMRAFAERPVLAAVDRYHFGFALGKALEDRGEYAESFHYYEQGNALCRQEANFKMDPIERTARRQQLHRFGRHPGDEVHRDARRQTGQHADAKDRLVDDLEATDPAPALRDQHQRAIDVQRIRFGPNFDAELMPRRRLDGATQMRAPLLSSIDARVAQGTMNLERSHG